MLVIVDLILLLAKQIPNSKFFGYKWKWKLRINPHSPPPLKPPPYNWHIAESDVKNNTFPSPEKY
jgi:hypothetical protein